MINVGKQNIITFLRITFLIAYFYYNKDENVHRFALSAKRVELLVVERERERSVTYG